MSTNTTKLDYARIRNAQRRTNKSIPTLADATTSQNNDNTTQNPQPLPPSNDSIIKQLSDNNDASTPMKQNNDFLNVFSNNFNSGNLDYLNSLILSNNKSGTSRDHSTKKNRGHKRAKSSLTESSQKPKAKLTNDENMEPSKAVQGGGNVSSVPVLPKIAQALTLKPDNENMGDGELGKEKENNGGGEYDTMRMNEEKLFEKYFRKGGLERRSMSVEDLRLEKKRAQQEVKDTERNMEMAVNNESSDKSGMVKGDVTARKDFLGSLGSYIQYFEKSEAMVKKNKSAILRKYFLDHEHKGNHMVKKELEVVRGEAKTMRKNMELVQGKLLELVKINKVVMRELNESRAKEEEYIERIREVETKFEQVKQRKEYYKGKVGQMQELLELERIDNENNLVVLKKVLSSNMSSGLDGRFMSYASNKRDKPLKDKDYLRGLLHQQKKTLENPLKEKKPTNGGVYHNNRYDLQLNQKLKGNKDTKMYDISMYSQKTDMRSESHDYTSENNNQSDSSMNYMDTSYQRDLYQDMFASEMNEKKMTKESQIRYIQDKLVELMEGQDINPFAYERSSSQKSLGKHRHKASEPNLQNYVTNREKKSSYPKSNHGQIKKSDYQLKTKIKSNIENSPPADEVVNLCYLTNKSD